MNVATKPLPQVMLRAVEPEDLDWLYCIENDRALWDVGTTNVPYSRYALHEYLAAITGDIYTDKQVRQIIQNGAGESIGIVDIINFDPRHLRAEVGIVVETPHRGQGYAAAALCQVAGYARSILHLHQLYAYADAGNAGSIEAFEHAGFQCSAKLKSWLFDGKNFHDAVLMQLFL